ncbi:hypothetical protein C8A00DRAFT_41407 [Chaetomidium leptoderma]|uniref:Uncharacterized protein n=1 Tax=Chaetomidium leptoderma TaxID=669021 RepID=A0AAN6VRF4_9PEZI|nr:hypothetical protein C8A00DRAFT_41407 [Chaetomidium leptoderma]
MDPTTTLFTFMLTYTMERDNRRDRGQWKGCYTFKDITCEGDAGSIPKRDGGLKMGHTYYYYYELDGASEAHDPSQPSTNTCPYLPGQTVNTLWIPVEQPGRKRSASLTSLHKEDFKTMDPASKFVAPRAAPCPPEPTRRIGTAPLQMQQKRTARSPSPSSRWPFSRRKLFSRKSSSSSLGDAPRAEDERSLRSEGSRSRDISPESLRRFLVDDAPLDHDEDSNRLAIAIPEDIVEENEDDDNFATSAVSEQYTGLSPPPPRSMSPAMSTASRPTSPNLPVPAAPTRPPPQLPTLKIIPTRDPQPNFPLSALCAAGAHHHHPFPDSPDSATLPAFYLSDDEDDEDMVDALPPPALDTTTAPFVARNLTATLSTYSLPRTAGTDAGKLDMQQQQQLQQEQQQPAALGAVVAGGAAAASLMLSSPIPDAGLGELVSELGWMAEMIRGRYA